jgi:hypothetical protein
MRPEDEGEVEGGDLPMADEEQAKHARTEDEERGERHQATWEVEHHLPVWDVLVQFEALVLPWRLLVGPTVESALPRAMETRELKFTPYPNLIAST